MTPRMRQIKKHLEANPPIEPGEVHYIRHLTKEEIFFLMDEMKKYGYEFSGFHNNAFMNFDRTEL